MLERKKGLREGAPNNVTCDANNNSIETKWARILRALADGDRLTRFDAERLGDHALNSTVSTLGRMGVSIAREPVVVEGRFGPIHCKRYWIEPTERSRALALLGGEA